MSLDKSADAEARAGAFSVLLLLTAFTIWAGHIVKRSRAALLTQGSLALLAGLAAGGGLFAYFEFVKGRHIPSSLVAFKYDMYMHLLLPPIIFYAGFSIKKKEFFANFDALSLLGVGGTLLSAFVLAAVSGLALRISGLDSHEPIGNALALGTVFSSTDSVAALQALNAATHPQLHALVFGEAVVNDATAIVLLHAVQNVRSAEQLTPAAVSTLGLHILLQGSCSLILGTTVGLIAAWILKQSFYRSHSTDHEVSLLAILGFLSYLAAERLGLSGVFSSFLCGITMSHYAWHSLSPTGKVVSVYAFRVLSFLAELILFMACGLDLWSTSLWHKEIYTKQRLLRQTAMLGGIISSAVPIVRFLVTLPLIMALNVWRSKGRQVNFTDGLALAWAGCARGAVTLALAVNHFVGEYAAGKGASVENQAICAACMVAVVASTLLLGGITPHVLKRLLEWNVRGGGKDPPSSFAIIDSYAPLPGAHGRQDGMEGEMTLSHGVGNGASSPARSDSLPILPGIKFRGQVHDAWARVDRGLLQPIFGGRSISLERSPPPSPGRWYGASSAIHVLQRGVQEQGATAPQPSPFEVIEAQDLISWDEECYRGVGDETCLCEDGAEQGVSGDRRTEVEEIFCPPGGGRNSKISQAFLDARLQAEGMVGKAEDVLEGAAGPGHHSC